MGAYKLSLGTCHKAEKGARICVISLFSYTSMELLSKGHVRLSN